VRAPKVYVRDNGLLHALLDLENRTQLLGHPKAGASWESFAIDQVLALLGIRDAYYWRTHQGAELDLMIIHKGKRYGFEMRMGDAPTATRSMHIAMGDLGLDRLYVIYPGKHSYLLGDKIQVVSIFDLQTKLADLM
jgi:uncharacterized protein